MAKADRFIALDISSEYIRLAVVSCGLSGAVEIGEVESVLLTGDAAAGMSQDAVIATALKRLLDRAKPGIRKTVISIAGASVFSRLVKLPPVSSDKVSQTIRHEAVQNIPFPLDDVVWDAHIFNPEVSEPEVLLVAVKSDYIAGLVHAASANGLTVERVVPAPAALADSVRYDHRDSGESVLLADRTSSGVNLIFVDGNRTFFRTIPVVGEDDMRLAREIERSITFYRGQQAGRAPAKVLLTGRGGIESEELVSRLSVPVEVFRPSCSAGASGSSAVMAGMAVHRYLENRIELNLLPQGMKEERAMRGLHSLRIVSGVLALLLIGLWGWFVNVLAGQRHQENRDVLRAVAALSAVERELIPIEERTALLKRDFEMYTDALEMRAFWLATLTDIEQVLPDGMFVQSSKPIRNEGKLEGLQISVISYLDKEPSGQDAVKALRDSFRLSERFNDQSGISSRPSKQLFARSFVLDLFFEEVP